MDKFWILVYELDKLYNFSEIKEDLSRIDSKMNKKDKKNLSDIFDKIINFNYSRLEYLRNSIKWFSNRWTRNLSIIKKLQLELNNLLDLYYQLETSYRLTGKNKYMVLVICSVYEPEYQYPFNTYRFLVNLNIIRNDKIYPVTDDLILKVFCEDINIYRSSLFINKFVDILYINDFYASIFENYLNRIDPITHQDSIKVENNISCTESSNGILRGIVHMINYGDPHSFDQNLISDIIESGYLEISFRPRNPYSGIFTTAIGYGSEILDFYPDYMAGIFLIISLGCLEEYDYWGGVHGMGSRKETDFYKGICHKCGDGLEQYSAAERFYMAMMGDKKNFHELIFSSDIDLKRYLEAIYVPSSKKRESLMKNENISEYIKSLIIDDIPKDKVFRKGCDGETPKKINRLEFNKLVKVVKKRQKMDIIPKINYEAINMKRKVKFIYDPMKGGGGTDFPMPP